MLSLKYKRVLFFEKTSVDATILNKTSTLLYNINQYVPQIQYVCINWICSKFEKLQYAKAKKYFKIMPHLLCVLCKKLGYSNWCFTPISYLHQIESLDYSCKSSFFFFFTVTFTRFNVKNLQSPGNLNWYIAWETKNGLKSNLN